MIVYGLLAVAALIVLFLSLKPIKVDTLVSNPQPSQSYQESIKRIQEIRTNDAKGLAPTGHLILMDHGRKVKKVIVFFHGFTSSPRQFKSLGERFYKLGYNVYIPRIPHHGMNDQMLSNLNHLTAEKLIQTSDQAVDVAQGLGEQVIVVGLSMGGAMAGWLAQFRLDIEKAVIIAPTFGTARVPSYFLKHSANYFLSVPNHFIWWDSRQKSNLIRPTGTYQGFPSRAMGEVRRLGLSVKELSKRMRPRAQSILMITNANDDAVSKEGVDVVVNNWKSQGFPVSSFEFSKESNLGHDLIDPEQRNQNVALVYPKIIELIDAKK